MAYERGAVAVVSVFLYLALAVADIREVRCSPYSTSSDQKTFRAHGTLDLSKNTADLLLSLNGEEEYQQEFILAATYDRHLYKMYFLEDQGGQVPSIVLRISQSQLAPTSNLYLQNSETMSAACDLIKQ